MTASKYHNISVDEDTFAIAKEKADKMGISVSALMSIAIRDIVIERRRT